MVIRSYFNLQIRLGDHDVTRFDETDNQVNFKEQKMGGPFLCSLLYR